jgi:hypothetical protein
MGLAPKCHFVMGLPSWSPRIPKIETHVSLEAHNFVCKPSIEMRSKVKLYLSSRDFQRYVAHHLHTRELGRFLAFSGWE